MKFGITKLESWGYHADSEEIMTLAFFVLTQYWLVTDRRTDGRTDGQTTLRSLWPAL